MDFTQIAGYLKIERARLDQAISALEGLNPSRPRRGRPPKSQSKQPAPHKRKMNAAARARIGAAKKAWWAKQKGKASQKKAAAPAKKSTRRRMSPAMKKKLSRLMKARWAARKKAGEKALHL
jgi:hypothetical protein